MIAGSSDFAIMASDTDALQRFPSAPAIIVSCSYVGHWPVRFNFFLPAAGLLPFARCSQFAVEELGSGFVGADPIAPTKQVVDFIGED